MVFRVALSMKAKSLSRVFGIFPTYPNLGYLFKEPRNQGSVSGTMIRFLLPGNPTSFGVLGGLGSFTATESFILA